MVALEEQPIASRELEEHNRQKSTAAWTEESRLQARQEAARDYNHLDPARAYQFICKFANSGSGGSSAGSFSSYNSDPGGVQYWNNRGQ
ncbi:MAG: hypothetical protein NT164_08090 [Verrucomicrobiae bacterium]|nr:hypothetical protein [Verrucomicrobiae bacterium]